MSHESLSPEAIPQKLQFFSAEGRINFAISQNSINIEGSDPIELSAQEYAFLSVLTSPMGKPRLAIHLAKSNEALEAPVDVSAVESEVHSKLSGTALHGLLISVGYGSATWYGALDADSDDAQLSFAEAGISIIDESKDRAYRKRRRRQVFTDLVSLINKDEDIEDAAKFTTNKKLLGIGAGAVAISIGSAATIYVIKSRKK